MPSRIIAEVILKMTGRKIKNKSPIPQCSWWPMHAKALFQKIDSGSIIDYMTAKEHAQPEEYRIRLRFLYHCEERRLSIMAPLALGPKLASGVPLEDGTNHQSDSRQNSGTLQENDVDLSKP